MFKTLSKLACTAALALGIPSAASAELPGMRGTQHIGITVPDVDEAVNFLVDVLGCEAFFSFGPFGRSRTTGCRRT